MLFFFITSDSVQNFRNVLSGLGEFEVGIPDTIRGVALIAAKSYYFGVGGSVADFCALVASDGRFACETVRTFEDGQSNRREVLRVRWSEAVEESAGSKRARTEEAGPGR